MKFIPYLQLLPVLLFLTACSDGDSPAATAVATTSSNLPEPGVTTNASSEMTFTLKRQQRIQEMESLSLLRCDSIGYDCAYDPDGGSFRMCYLDDKLVRATHTYVRGNRGGGSETYFYDDGEVFAAELRSFTPDEEETVHEERRYYYAGNLIDRTYRDYTPPPGGDRVATVPDQRTGRGVDDGIGSEVMLQVARRGSYTCE